jgi:hypothetical protein
MPCSPMRRTRTQGGPGRYKLQELRAAVDALERLALAFRRADDRLGELTAPDSARWSGQQ